MTATFQRDSKKVVKIFTGTIFHRGQCINVRFDCYTDEVEPLELYECIDINSIEGLPYSMIGDNIQNKTFSHSREYKDD
jgi:hypothetical protein